MNPRIKASWPSMAASLFWCILHTVRRKAKGLRALTSSEERRRREDDCNGCNAKRNDGRCSECGCILKYKVKLITAECPLGKWESISEGGTE